MRPDIHTLTGAYAVDALPEDERDHFEAHLEECDACAQEVAELQATAARLGGMVSEQPPPDLRSRVLAEIDQTRQVGPVARGPARDELAARRARPRWQTTVLAPAAAIVAILAVGLSVLVADLSDRIEELETANAQVVEVLSAQDAETITVEAEDGSFARVVVAASRGEAVFVADGMPALSPEETYELWLIGDEGPVPAGLFDVDEHGRATQLLTGDLQQAAAIGVTVEPAGGSPEPTSDPVMVVELGDA
jgi:anti-sigma-K factor RskA